MTKKKQNSDTEPKKRRSGLGRFLRGFCIAVDVVLVAALALTGYAGMVSPLQHGGLWGVFPLVFMPLLVLCLVLLLAQLFFCRAGAGVLFAGFLICAGPVLDNCPFNFSSRSVPEGAESFTLMSYNVHNFGLDDGTENPDTTSNPQVDYILEQNADIVCLQEASWIGTYSSKHLSWSQRERFFKTYPYVITDGTELALLSKYPVKVVHLDNAKENFAGGLVACYHITLPSSRILSIMNVHLDSPELANEDREMYMQLTDLQKRPVEDVKTMLFDKIRAAAVNRAVQARQLLRYIRLYCGPDAVLTGDFNDVPGCYTIRTLEDAGFRDVYPSVGLGPMITFNSTRMYLCIDHTMCRGKLVPVDMRKGRTRASDHYPLVTTFYVDKNQ